MKIRNRGKIATVIAGALMIGGSIVAAQPALAAQQGLCMSNYNSTCARQASPYVDSWPQDIGGDAYQDYTRTYLGQVSSNTCWPFNPCSLDVTYNNNSVWAFQNIATQKCISVYGYGNKANARGCNYTSDEAFVWTATGALVNVYQSDYYGSPQFLMGQGAGSCMVNWYVPLVTWNGGSGFTCTTTWTMRNG